MKTKRGEKPARGKKLTFLWQNMANNTINTLEWITDRRTIEQAWDDATVFLRERRNPTGLYEGEEWDGALVMTFEGLCKVWPDDRPLRAARPEDLKELNRTSP